MSNSNHQTSRRSMIQSLASASMLLPGMLHEMLAAETPNDPLAPRAPMFPAKAKRVIFLYMSGGVSHVDTFDPKPKLQANHRVAYKDDFLHVGSMMDEVAVIRSMHNDIPNHPQAVLQIHGGSTIETRPSMGSWMSYG